MAERIISVRLPENVVAGIDWAASRARVSRSRWIQETLNAAIEPSYRQEPPAPKHEDPIAGHTGKELYLEVPSERVHPFDRRGAK